MFQNHKSRGFGENDYVIEQSEIFILGQTNSIIHQCLTLCQRGDLTFEQAMMSAVKFLAIQNKNMFDELVKQANERIVPPNYRMITDEK